MHGILLGTSAHMGMAACEYETCRQSRLKSRLERLALNSPPIRRSNDALSPLPPNHRRSMDWHFRSRRAEPKGGADPPRPASTGNAERALRALLAASIILPILIFSGVAWIAYQQHF